MEPPNDLFIVELSPEWGFGDMVLGTLPVSAETRQRAASWNETWETVLNPVSEIRWPDANVGRAWYREGLDLIDAIQQELGGRYRVMNGFSAYNPDADPQRAGST
ncbi:hypothetical protein [Microbacterium halophytorum]|uniref:hypothetical protein n=1 Tax=Microbacterium halophytorum TaxID=2067568 RepID=UPI000CFAA653|nr:hypothetical protein [Microbacterium halophytorum]